MQHGVEPEGHGVGYSQRGIHEVGYSSGTLTECNTCGAKRTRSGIHGE